MMMIAVWKRVARVPLALVVVLATVLMAPTSAGAATTAIPRDAVTDNYKASYNTDPTIRERRTWFAITGLTVGTTTYVLATPPATIQFPGAVALRGSDGSVATLELRMPWDNLGSKGFRVDPNGHFGVLIGILDPSRLAATPLGATLALTSGGIDVATAPISYRYDAVVANAVAPSIEYNGPGGRWWTEAGPTRLDWETAPAPAPTPTPTPTPEPTPTPTPTPTPEPTPAPVPTPLPDRTAPVLSEVALPASTKTRTVTVTITATDNVAVTQVRFANEDGVWAPWQPFSPTMTHQLSPEAHKKGVYTQVRDAAGNTSASLYRKVTCSAPCA